MRQHAQPDTVGTTSIGRTAKKDASQQRRYTYRCPEKPSPIEDLRPDVLEKVPPLAERNALAKHLMGHYFNDIMAISEEQPPLSYAESRAQLFARLGIWEEQAISETPLDIDKLIATLCHPEAQKRIEATHILVNEHPQLMKGNRWTGLCINLVLMVWRDADPYARIAAIKALAIIGCESAADAIQIALRDEHQDVRAIAARALGDIGDQTSIAELVAASRDPHWSVRASAIQAMGTLKLPAFLNAVMAALDDNDPSVRIEAIHALAQLRGIEATPRLCMLAQRAAQLDVRHAAVIALEMLFSASKDSQES